MSHQHSVDAYRPTLLDVPISYFVFDGQRNTFANVPAQTTTLRRIVITKHYRPQITAIRESTDKLEQEQLKKKLPAITPVALLYHRRKDTSFVDRIRQQWPLLMGDLDQKDNPGVDMGELKKALQRLPYVMLCAYSVRGGLWFVVRLPDPQTPETITAHFRYLQKLFADKFGIKLDGSKGGNPTDLRFVSYDDDPYLNDNPTVMQGVYTSPKPKPIRPFSNSQLLSKTHRASALQRCVQIIEDAPDGEKHRLLNRAAYTAGGYIASGVIDYDDAINALEDAISRKPNVTDRQAASITIKRGIRDGEKYPIYEETAAPVVLPSSEPVTRQIRPAAVRTIVEQQQYPGSILRPHESQLERLTTEPLNYYPQEWDSTVNQWNHSHPPPPLFWDADMVRDWIGYAVIND